MFLDGVPDEIAWRDEFLSQHCADLGIRLETRPGPPSWHCWMSLPSEDVDVIALGWRQNLAPERAVVVREVLQRARRPVALIPRGHHDLGDDAGGRPASLIAGADATARPSGVGGPSGLAVQGFQGLGVAPDEGPDIGRQRPLVQDSSG